MTHGIKQEAEPVAWSRLEDGTLSLSVSGIGEIDIYADGRAAWVINGVSGKATVHPALAPAVPVEELADQLGAYGQIFCDHPDIPDQQIRLLGSSETITVKALLHECFDLMDRAAAALRAQPAPAAPGDGEEPWVQVGFLKEKLRQAEAEAEVWKERAMSLRTTALRVQPAPQVKALEWLNDSHGLSAYGLTNATICYHVVEHGPFVQLSIRGAAYTEMQAYVSAGEAQAAAQADYERRILSALSVDESAMKQLSQSREQLKQ